MDYLKKNLLHFGGKIRSQDISSQLFEQRSFRALIIDNHLNYQIHIDEFGKLFRVRLLVFSDFTLSINNPEKVSFITQIVDSKEDSPPLYILHERDSEFTKGHKYNPFLSENFQAFWAGFKKYVSKLELARDETITIRKDGLFFTLHRERNLVNVVNGAITLINKSCNVFTLKNQRNLSTKGFPDSLKPLLRYLKKWGVHDETERLLLISSTKDWQKKKLIENISPLEKDIKAYLKLVKNGRLGTEAILLRNLMKLVDDLKSEERTANGEA